MRFFQAAAGVSIALVLAGCSGRSGAPSSGVGGTATPLQIPYGSGNIRLTDSVTYSSKFRVKGCWVSPPGSSVLSGYSMTVVRGRAFMSGGILVRNYSHDGTFAVDAKEMPVTMALYVQKSPMLPDGAILTNGKNGTLTVNIADGGKSGKAEFKNWNGGKAHPGPISGTLTWTCGLVRRT